MNEVPNENANPTIAAFIDLGGFDDLLLQGCGDPPIHHVPGILVLVGASHKTGVMRAQTGGEHPSAPWPPGLHQVVLAIGHLHHIEAGVVGLLFSRIGDLRNRRHLPLARLADASVVAVSYCVDGAISPDSSTQGRLFGDLHVLVEVDPTAATWSLVRKRLCRHEVIGGLNADAHVDLIRTVGQLDLLPKFRILGIVLAVVELLDATGGHVFGAILGGAVRQGTQAPGEEVDDRQLQLREEVLQLGCPFHANEAGAHNQNRGLLLVEIMQLLVLFQHMATAALQVALVDVLPIRMSSGLFVHSGEPQGLTHGLERSEVATGANDAIVEANLLHVVRANGLDGGRLTIPVELLHFTPDEFHAHLSFIDRLQGEGQGIEVRRSDEGTEHARGILEVLLAVHHCHVKFLLQLAGAKIAGELATDQQHSLLRAGRCHRGMSLSRTWSWRR
mmetsp:Transcript_55116/g.120579  ORF Transcript_55116/g.120579 Transcript_55116/m.120579 type:complete len:446 (-) Transcript_55116:16-1353(-)